MYKPRTRVQIRTNASSSAKCVKRPPTSKELPTDFQSPSHLTVSDSQPSKGPNACPAFWRFIFWFLLWSDPVLVPGFWVPHPIPAEYTPSIGNSWRPPHPPSRLHSILWQRRLYPNLSYLFIRVKMLFATRVRPKRVGRLPC